MDFAEQQRLGVAPTPQGELRASVAWINFLAVAAAVLGALCVWIFFAQLGGAINFAKIAPLSRNLLLVLGLSTWLGSYLLFRLARSAARSARSPDVAHQRAAMLASSWFWRGAMLVALAVLALSLSVADDLFAA